MKRNISRLLLFSCFFFGLSVSGWCQTNDSTQFNETWKQSGQNGTNLPNTLPSLTALTNEALNEWESLNSNISSLLNTLEKYKIPLSDLESYLEQSAHSLKSMKASLEAMGERLQEANEDYAAEQEYHKKIENGLKIKTTALTVTVCVAGAVAVGAVVWALVN